MKQRRRIRVVSCVGPENGEIINFPDTVDQFAARPRSEIADA